MRSISHIVLSATADSGNAMTMHSPTAGVRSEQAEGFKAFYSAWAMVDVALV
jgi:hypothetical protein